MENANWWIIAGSIFGGISVLLGAFGAHALEDTVTADRLNTFEIGVRYQMYHAFALIILGLMENQIEKSFNLTGYSFIFGILIFSGSLYLLVLTDTPQLGAITPIGGVAFVFGWFYLAYSFIKEGLA